MATKLIIASIFVCLSALMSASFAPSGQSIGWKLSTPLPEPRAGYAAGLLDGKLVIAGGTYWEGAQGHWTKKLYSTSTHAFDPFTGKWEKLPHAPIPIGYPASVVVRNKLFVLGGYTGSKTSRKILVLQKKGNDYVWDLFGELPEERLFASAMSVGSRLYLLGGTSQYETLDAAGSCCTSKTATNSLMVLDTNDPRKAWRQLPPYPGARRWLFSAETDGKSIWMFGGMFQAEVNDPRTKFNEVLQYRLTEGKWEVRAPMPEAVREAAPLSLVRVRDKIVFITISKKVWAVDLKTLLYSELSPLPQPAYVDKFVAIRDLLVGAGGETSIEGPRRRSEWTFIGRFVTQ